MPVADGIIQLESVHISSPTLPNYADPLIPWGGGFLAHLGAKHVSSLPRLRRDYRSLLHLRGNYVLYTFPGPPSLAGKRTQNIMFPQRLPPICMA